MQATSVSQVPEKQPQRKFINQVTKQDTQIHEITQIHVHKQTGAGILLDNGLDSVLQLLLLS